jgi:hypothetical protein
MEEKVSVWKANLSNGLILGFISVIFTLVLYFFDLTFNKTIPYFLLLIQVVILYYMIKAYRDNYRHGMLTYGQSVGAGVVLMLYSIVISVIFTYILYKFIDTGLTAKLLANTEETYVKRGMDQTAIDAAMAFSKKLLTPEFTLITGLFGGMVGGTIISLLVSIFTRKEGNPLIDDPKI